MVIRLLKVELIIMKILIDQEIKEKDTYKINQLKILNFWNKIQKKKLID